MYYSTLPYYIYSMTLISVTGIYSTTLHPKTLNPYTSTYFLTGGGDFAVRRWRTASAPGCGSYGTIKATST